ncbi:MAG TPA: CrcB family protein [Kineosporiaceae bacterium]|nr:CrcB family protein [Kineosporiaceae bacterium]
MSTTRYLLIALTGGVGAITRFAVDGALRARWPGHFPWQTILINVTGSLLLGFLTGLVLFHAEPALLTAVLGTGFCGGYTTFSTASFETVRLVRDRAPLLAFANAIGTPLLSIAAAAAGLVLAHG